MGVSQINSTGSYCGTIGFIHHVYIKYRTEEMRLASLIITTVRDKAHLS